MSASPAAQAHAKGRAETCRFTHQARKSAWIRMSFIIFLKSVRHLHSTFCHNLSGTDFISHAVHFNGKEGGDGGATDTRLPPCATSASGG